MSSVPTGTNYAGQTQLVSTNIDTDTEAIRKVLDGDYGLGIDYVTNFAASPRLRASQTAEPSARMMLNVPFLDIQTSSTDKAPFSIRVYAVCPGNGRLARASVAWNGLAVSTADSSNTYLNFWMAVMGNYLFPSGTNYYAGKVQTEGVNSPVSVVQGTNDLKALQFLSRPSVAAWQPFPIDCYFDFDGNSPTISIEGLRVQLELNVEHSP